MRADRQDRMKTQFGHRAERRASGFTRTDLLSVAATAMLLGALQAATWGNAKVNTEAGVCLSNLRRLTTAWTQFAYDNNQNLAGDLSPVAPGSWIAPGYLDYSARNPNNTNTLSLVGSPSAQLGTYTRNVRIYRCPSDESRITIQTGTGQTVVPRVRSYSMNNAMNINDATIWLPAPPYRVFGKISDIVAPKPGMAFVFIDEHPGSINDGNFGVAMPGANLASARIIDVPASHHNRSGSLSFADGHAELHLWRDPRTSPPVQYGSFTALVVASPNNQDVRWLSDRTSSLKN